MKILHIAVENFAGIPMRLVQEERRRGHYSRLITLLSPHQKYEEDIALNLPFLNTGYMRYAKRFLRGKKNVSKSNVRCTDATAKIWKPANSIESALFNIRDIIWQPCINSALKEIGNIEEYDVIIADGGHDLTRFPKIISKTKTPAAVFYYGSDLRSRGIIAGVQSKSIATFTFEHDHTLLFPEAEFLFYPYIPPEYSLQVDYKLPAPDTPIIIGHAPTNRAAKGTDDILAALETLAHDYPIEILLIENVPHSEALRQKASCHLFIDQIGDLGYGLNSVESAWMSIPTCVEILPDFEEFLKNKCSRQIPFYNIRRSNLIEDMRRTLDERDCWPRRGSESATWVQKYHSVKNIADVYLARIEHIVNAPKNTHDI
ncbi:hypothetical protein MASR2M18_00610 [Ignavibacteria bacterium]|nr:hypothetical protein [Bacteroidota bacterium]MCZ2133617.1 hypothetical protein [Bacteroidota bacterium]